MPTVTSELKVVCYSRGEPTTENDKYGLIRTIVT